MSESKNLCRVNLCSGNSITTVQQASATFLYIRPSSYQRYYIMTWFEANLNRAGCCICTWKIRLCPSCYILVPNPYCGKLPACRPVLVLITWPCMIFHGVKDCRREGRRERERERETVQSMVDSIESGWLQIRYIRTPCPAFCTDTSVSGTPCTRHLCILP